MFPSPSQISRVSAADTRVVVERQKLQVELRQYVVCHPRFLLQNAPPTHAAAQPQYERRRRCLVEDNTFATHSGRSPVVPVRAFSRRPFVSGYNMIH